jgi:hypothetical protein
MNGSSELHRAQQPPIDAFIDGHYDVANRLSGREAVLLLMYTDVPMTDEVRAQSTAHTLSAPNTVAYAQELQAMASEAGLPVVKELAHKMSECAVAVLQTLDMQPTDYTRSPSWALHDWEKQRYWSRNSHDSAYPYTDSVGDMLTQRELRLRSIDRMVGWEIDLAARRGNLGRIDTTSLTTIDPGIDDKILAVINEGRRSPKAPHELSSEALGQLGKIIRSAIEKGSTSESLPVTGSGQMLGRHSAANARHSASAGQPLAKARNSLLEISTQPTTTETRPASEHMKTPETHVSLVVPRIGEVAIGRLPELSLDELNELVVRHSMTIPPRAGTPERRAYDERANALQEATNSKHAQRRRTASRQARAAILGPELRAFRDEVLGR